MVVEVWVIPGFVELLFSDSLIHLASKESIELAICLRSFVSLLGDISGPHTVAICKWASPKQDVIFEQEMGLRLYDVAGIDVIIGVDVGEGEGEGGSCCRIMFVLRA